MPTHDRARGAGSRGRSRHVEHREVPEGGVRRESQAYRSTGRLRKRPSRRDSRTSRVCSGRPRRPSGSTRGTCDRLGHRRGDGREPARRDPSETYEFTRCTAHAPRGGDRRPQGQADVRLRVRPEEVHARLYALGARGGRAARTWPTRSSTSPRVRAHRVRKPPDVCPICATKGEKYVTVWAGIPQEERRPLGAAPASARMRRRPESGLAPLLELAEADRGEPPGDGEEAEPEHAGTEGLRDPSPRVASRTSAAGTEETAPRGGRSRPRDRSARTDAREHRPPAHGRSSSWRRWLADRQGHPSPTLHAPGREAR